jgi:hypothetical protein
MNCFHIWHKATHLAATAEVYIQAAYIFARLLFQPKITEGKEFIIVFQIILCSFCHFDVPPLGHTFI